MSFLYYYTTVAASEMQNNNIRWRLQFLGASFACWPVGLACIDQGVVKCYDSLAWINVTEHSRQGVEDFSGRASSAVHSHSVQEHFLKNGWVGRLAHNGMYVWPIVAYHVIVV